jgi:4-hydroxy-2-oxoheptanedioate aldolase
MTSLPRLNPVIRALESGKAAFATFSQASAENAVALSASAYDGVIFEMEHYPWDALALRDSLQYMLNRAQIAGSGSLAPAVAPFVRIPPNGAEMGQVYAKQALDVGVYGIVFPHVSTVDEARNAVAACRYPRLKEHPLYEPAGLRGDGPTTAVRYWGLTQQQYYERADVWPLNPAGEILAIVQIEDTAGIENLPSILRAVPGIGVVLLGEGDLSQELGYPRQYEHPVVLEWIARAVAACREAGVVVGHPHVDNANVARILNDGFRFLMTAPVRTYGALDAGRALAGRS